MGQLLWKDSNIVTSPHECQCHLQYITFSARASGEENVLSSSTKKPRVKPDVFVSKDAPLPSKEVTKMAMSWHCDLHYDRTHPPSISSDYMNIKKKSHARSASIKYALGDHQNRIGSATMSLYFCSPFGRHFNLQQHYLTQASHAFGVSTVTIFMSCALWLRVSPIPSKMCTVQLSCHWDFVDYLSVWWQRI